MQQPLISIIVPCYNVEEYLPKCVESIQAQTYKNWELILVDDGSKDNTPQICDKYAVHNSRIMVIHKSNGGLVSARNAGYDMVAGEWITYLDGDDWFSENFIETVTCAILSNSNIDMIFFSMSQELNGKTIDNKWNWSQYEDGRIYEKNENLSLSSYVLNYNSGLSDVCGKVFRTEWCRNYNIKHNSNLRQGEESVDVMMRAFYYASKSLFIKDKLYHYRYNANSISKRVDENNAACIVDCMKVIYNFIKDIPENDIFLKEFTLRNAYVLISIAMHTYFHPANHSTYKQRKYRFKKLINDNPLFKHAIKEVSCNQFDKFRGIALWSIQHQNFFLLELIGWAKNNALKLGIFNY